MDKILSLLLEFWGAVTAITEKLYQWVLKFVLFIWKYIVLGFEAIVEGVKWVVDKL